MSELQESNTKTVYGQAWIQEDRIYQQTTTYLNIGGKPVATDSTDCFREPDSDKTPMNIWENLMGPAMEEAPGTDYGKPGNYGYYQANGNKKYFYWIYKQSSVDGAETVNVRLECPKPKEGLLEELFVDEKGFKISPMDWDLDSDDSPVKDSPWAKYWAGEKKIGDMNYNNRAALKVKEVDLNSFQTMNYQEEKYIENPAVKIKNTDFGNAPGPQEGDDVITDLLNLF